MLYATKLEFLFSTVETMQFPNTKLSLICTKAPVNSKVNLK